MTAGKMFPWLLALWLFSALPPSPGHAAAAEAVPQGGVSVTDFRGKTITLHRPAGRIVCLIESALSGLYMLGAEHRVVAVSTNVYQGEVYPHYAAMDRRIADKALPTPGNWDFVNLERVVALEPDLVIIWAHQEESIRAMEERGIPVYGVFIRSFEDIHREMLALGDLTGTRERAEELIAFTEGEIRDLQLKTGSAPRRPRVYFMWAQGELETSGAGSTVDELIRLAGGVNVCRAIDQEHLVVSIERIIEWDPELIVMWTNELRDPGDIMALSAWKGVSAVRSGRVHELPGVFACDLWTLKYQLAAWMVAKWSHPEIFRDLDLEREMHRVFSRLYGSKWPSSRQPLTAPSGHSKP